MTATSGTPALAARASDIWSALAAPIPSVWISWRQDGKPIQRDGKWFARFVCYIEAGTVRERLDSIVPGEWDLTLELLPQLPDGDGAVQIAFKARIQILGVIREDVGIGDDYKAAATDAFKRAAVRFGIGHELSRFEPNWVQVDGDGKYAKPLEDPQTAYDTRLARKAERNVNQPAARALNEREAGASTSSRPANGGSAPTAARTADEPQCPKCGGRMFSNVAENDVRAARGEKLRPDHRCRNRSCDGVIWRPRDYQRKPDVIAADGVGEYLDEEVPF